MKPVYSQPHRYSRKEKSYSIISTYVCREIHLIHSHIVLQHFANSLETDFFGNKNSYQKMLSSIFYFLFRVEWRLTFPIVPPVIKQPVYAQMCVTITCRLTSSVLHCNTLRWYTISCTEYYSRSLDVKITHGSILKQLCLRRVMPFNIFLCHCFLCAAIVDTQLVPIAWRTLYIGYLATGVRNFKGWFYVTK